jgi:hypothetical protein
MRFGWLRLNEDPELSQGGGDYAMELVVNSANDIRHPPNTWFFLTRILLDNPEPRNLFKGIQTQTQTYANEFVETPQNEFPANEATLGRYADFRRPYTQSDD